MCERVWRRPELIIAASLVAACSSDSLTGTSGRHWVVQSSGTTQDLFGVWGSSASDVFAVGQGGTILHYDGSSWSVQVSGTTAELSGVWGSSPTDVFAVGRPATILHFDGSRWSAQSGAVPQSFLRGVWGTSAADVFVVGSIISGTATVLRYNGTAWRAETLATTASLASVWGTSSANVIAVGMSGSVVRYNGSSWTGEYGGGFLWNLGGVWGSAANDVFAVGYVQDNLGGWTSRVLHYDGARWATVASGAIANLSLTGVWGVSSSDVFVVGGVLVGDRVQGTIHHYSGGRWSRWSREPTDVVGPLAGVSGAGSDVFAVGASGLIIHGSR